MIKMYNLYSFCVFASLFLFLVGGVTVFAAESDPRALFREVAPMSRYEHSVPVVYRVDVPEEQSNSILFGIYESKSASFIQYSIERATNANLSPSIRLLQDAGRITNNILDGDANTFLNIEAFPDGFKQGDLWTSSLQLRWSETITANNVVIILAESSKAPNRVQVKVDGKVVAQWRAYSASIGFPTAKGRVWTIEMQHTNPIQIAEVDVPYTVNPNHTIIFLAQPDEQYFVYSNPIEKRAFMNTSPLTIPSQTMQVSAGSLTFQKNSFFLESDPDSDSVSSDRDNCLEYPNPFQEDVNNNGIGDLCEDFDLDGYAGAVDNCPNRPNPLQEDSDEDGLGDACDDEESRLTERYVWVPWVGIGVAVLVILGLFVLVQRRRNIDADMESKNST
jgi:hypothetical protein